jgi:hypothetical protein
MKLFMSQSLELCLVLVMGLNSRQQEILGRYFILDTVLVQSRKVLKSVLYSFEPI